MRRTFLLLFLCAFAPFAVASHFGDFHVIPAAAHARGVFGSMWQTDVIVHNFQTGPLTIEIGVVESGLGSADNFFPVMIGGESTVTIPGGATLELHDLLNDHRDREATLGALLIGGDHPFAVTSRVYNVEPDGATVGQSVPVTEEFLNSSSQVALIPGLMANADFRTNLGFVAAAGGLPMVVEVALRGADGTSLGATTFNIDPEAMVHVQFSSTAITTTPFDLATATLRIIAGSGDLTGYASVVDNRSNHAAFVGSGFAGTTMSVESNLERNLRRLRERRNRVHRTR